MLVARYGVSIGEGGNRNSSLDSMWWRETWFVEFQFFSVCTDSR